MKSAILSVIYYEPDWFNTAFCISQLKPAVPTFFVDRGGIGGLSEALNRGFNENQLWEYEYVWMLTNVSFAPDTLSKLSNSMDWNPKYAAVTPAFQSDHQKLRPSASDLQSPLRPVPFIEFTAALVRSAIFKEQLLDDRMPYAGHDIDWGYRIRELGHLVGVCDNARIDHTYIHRAVKRQAHPVTLKRWKIRQYNEQSTKEYLHKKHGPDWAAKLQCSY